MLKIKHKIINGIECKWCNICKQWRELCCFSKDKKGRKGLSSQCKDCKKRYDKQFHIDNSEKLKQQSKQYNIDNPEVLKQWRDTHVEERKQYAKQYYLEHSEELKQERNKKTKHIKKYGKQYRKEHKAERNALTSKYRATKLNQTPDNADLKKIQFIYDVCAETNELLGEPYFHVDHIQPIAKGGLHHEANLQILESTLNMEKNAKWPLTAGEKIKYAGVIFNEQY